MTKKTVILLALIISAASLMADDKQSEPVDRGETCASQKSTSDAQQTDTLDQKAITSQEEEQVSHGLTEEWIQKTKKPFTWLKWGADLRAREEFLSNAQQNSSLAVPDKNHQRYRFRVWADITPVDYFTFSARAMYALRYFIEPESTEGWESGEVMFDNLYATIKPVDSNWRLRIGRQELMDLDQRWLVQDGTTRDGSRTTFFDAARFTWECPDEETTIDAVYLYQCAESDAWLPPIDMQNTRKYLAEDDIQGGMFLVRNKHFEKTIIDSFIIYKHEYPGDLASSIYGDSVTIQPKVSVKWNEHWSMVAQAAGQFGKRNDRDFLAYGADAKVTYAFQDVVKSKVWLGFEYLSGDKGGNGTDNGFDPLWARYPRISEIMAYTRVESGRACDYSNMYSPYVGYSFISVTDLCFTGTYRPMFAPENPDNAYKKYHTEDGHFKGHLIQGKAEYQFTKHIKTQAVIETIIPGNYYTDLADDTALFIRGQVFLTW